MASKEEIKEHLDSILIQVAKSQNIENFEINPSTEANYGDGFVAQFYTGDIRDKDTGETTVVAIKKAPIFEFDYQAIFKNEELFYSTVFPPLDTLQKQSGVRKPFDHIPKYFCGSLESKKEYIAMENLKPFGYVMFDKKEYLNKEHLEMIFKIYGKFHALSYVLRKKDVEQYQQISKDLTNVCIQLIDFLGKPMIASVAAAVKALDSEDDKVIYEEIQDLGEHTIQTFLNSCTYKGEHRCLVHGDCWSNNMLFKYSETGKLLDVKLIDFQLCKDHSPINDLSYFFYSGASKEDFDNLDNYLKIYHTSFSEFAEELGANSSDIMSFETLKNEWRENALFGVIFGIYLWQVKLIPKKDITDVLTSNEVEKMAPEENIKIWETMMEAVHKTDEYRERTTAILRHAYEYGVLNKNTIVRDNI